MLTTRLLTIAVTVPLVVLGALFLPGWIIAAVFAALMLVGAREWGRLVGAPMGVQYALIGLVAVLSAVLVILMLTGHALTLATAFSMLAVVSGGFALSSLVAPGGRMADRLGAPISGSLFGAAALVGAVATIVWIESRPDASRWLLGFLILIWMVDSAGYVVGRLIGKRRLAPAISPGKTWAGAAAGVIAAVVVSILLGVLFGLAPGPFIGLVLLGGWLAVVAIAGDLLLSLVKRRAGVKDAGSVFPGHGGVLDRLDGAIVAAPWFAVGLGLVTGFGG